MSKVVQAPPMITPTPPINPESAPYWAATLEGRLLIRRCRSCGEAIWYPRTMCPFCHSTDTVWEESSGIGTVYAFSIVRRGRGDWQGEPPYVLAYVEIEEGPRMMTNIVGCKPEDVEIGMVVEVVFHKTAAAAALPRFRPRALSA